MVLTHSTRVWNVLRVALRSVLSGPVLIDHLPLVSDYDATHTVAYGHATYGHASTLPYDARSRHTVLKTPPPWVGPVRMERA